MMVTGTGGFLKEMLRLLLIGACAAIATAFSPASRLPAALNRGSVGSSLSLRPGGATRLRVGATGVRCQAGGPPLDKEPLDLCEENVIQALEEAKEVSFFGIDQPWDLHGWVKRRGQRDRQVARACYASRPPPCSLARHTTKYLREHRQDKARVVLHTPSPLSALASIAFLPPSL